MPTKEEIRRKISELEDPELGVSIVDLGLVYDVTVENGVVAVLMTMTTPFCPLDGYFRQEIEKRVRVLPGIKEVHVQFTFDPPWDRSKISEEARAALGM